MPHWRKKHRAYLDRISIRTVGYHPHLGYTAVTFASAGCYCQLTSRFQRPTSVNKHSKSLLPLARMALVVEDFTVPEDKVKAAKEVFKKFDKKSQDRISSTDLGPAFKALNLNVNADQLKEWADLVDEEATGFIEQEGFLILYGKKLKDDQDERDLRDAFRILDKNKRGEIDVEDLRWLLKSLGDDLNDEDIEDMIRETDTDGSGFVDFDEFYKLMTGD